MLPIIAAALILGAIAVQLSGLQPANRVQAAVLACAAVGAVTCLPAGTEDAALFGAIGLAAYWRWRIIQPRLSAQQDRQDHKRSILLTILQAALAAALLFRLAL